VRFVATSGGLILVWRVLGFLYNQFQEQQKSGWSGFTGGGGGLMASAEVILQRTVDPAETAVYAILGGSRPARTLERAGQGGTIILIVVCFIVAAGIAYGILF
jgi:hypothetical protein